MEKFNKIMKILQDSFKSKTVWGIIGMLASALGIAPEWIAAAQESLPVLLSGVALIGSALFTWWGRIVAKKPLGE